MFHFINGRTFPVFRRSQYIITIAEPLFSFDHRTSEKKQPFSIHSAVKLISDESTLHLKSKCSSIKEAVYEKLFSTYGFAILEMFIFLMDTFRIIDP